ncbi:MAG: hypothetical protein V4577_19060 [Bacteroidota bacterium]
MSQYSPNQVRKILFETIIAGSTLALIGYFIYWIKDFEHRLTKLEDNVDAISNSYPKSAFIGGYPYTVYRGTDSAPDGSVVLKVDIQILSKDYRWECLSKTQIEGNNLPDINEIIKDYSDDRELKDAVGIVCVGTASSEGNDLDEEDRAYGRAKTLVDIVKQNLISKKDIPVLGLNFGRYNRTIKGPCTDATINQRLIVIVKIIERSEKLTDEGLESSLRKLFVEKAANLNSRFPIDITQYTMYHSRQSMLVK